MAGKCRRYETFYNPITGRTSRRCVSRARGSSSLSGLGSFGQTGSLKSTFSGVKGVLITGAIAAGGVVVTQKVYDKLGKSLNLSGWQRQLAQMATGIALGIVIAKLLKKPKLAAAFAIGPVVAGAVQMFGDVVSSTPALSGLGLTAYNAINNPYESMYAPLYGARQGLGSTVKYQNAPAMPMPGRNVAPARSRKFNAATASA